MEKKYHTVPDVAKMLGVSERAIRNWIARKQISYYRVGRLIRFDDAQISSFIEGGKRVL